MYEFQLHDIALITVKTIKLTLKACIALISLALAQMLFILAFMVLGYGFIYTTTSLFVIVAYLYYRQRKLIDGTQRPLINIYLDYGCILLFGYTIPFFLVYVSLNTDLSEKALQFFYDHAFDSFLFLKSVPLVKIPKNVFLPYVENFTILYTYTILYLTNLTATILSIPFTFYLIASGRSEFRQLQLSNKVFKILIIAVIFLWCIWYEMYEAFSFGHSPLIFRTGMETLLGTPDERAIVIKNFLVQSAARSSEWLVYMILVPATLRLALTFLKKTNVIHRGAKN